MIRNEIDLDDFERRLDEIDFPDVWWEDSGFQVSEVKALVEAVRNERTGRLMSEAQIDHLREMEPCWLPALEQIKREIAKARFGFGDPIVVFMGGLNNIGFFSALRASAPTKALGNGGPQMQNSNGPVHNNELRRVVLSIISTLSSTDEGTTLASKAATANGLAVYALRAFFEEPKW